MYTSIDDSTPGARDVIADFASGFDKIDLTAIDAVPGGADDAFARVTSFTHVAGQLTVTFVSNHYEVRGDLDGDAAADFVINVTGRTIATGDIIV